jgi:hypothetical protein
MAVIQATLKAAFPLKDDTSGTVSGADRSGVSDTRHVYVTFALPAFTNADTGRILGTDLTSLIQQYRRDGKTVTLRSACRGESGYQSAFATNFFTSSESVSAGNVNFNMTNRSGSQIGSNLVSVGLGAGDRPFGIIVAFDVA